MIRFAVITLSDKGFLGEREDTAGPTARTLLEEKLAATCCETLLLPDDQPRIEAALRRIADESACDLIVTTGGTGLSPRDRTPEATHAVIDRNVPGMAEAMRAGGLAKTPSAMLSRGICGIRGRTLIINFGGSPNAVREQLSVILPALPHAIETLRGEGGDCARPSEAGR